MALTTPKTPAAYKAFFKELAEKHVNIRHDDDTRKNFTVVSLQTAMKGFSDDDIKAFLDSLRSKAASKQNDTENNSLMVLIELNGETNADEIKAGRKNLTGSIAILMRPEQNTADNKDQVKDICYQTGTDCVNVLIQYFKNNPTEGKVTEVTDESLYIAGKNLYGWRFDFSYYVTVPFCFNTLKFEDLTI